MRMLFVSMLFVSLARVAAIADRTLFPLGLLPCTDWVAEPAYVSHFNASVDPHWDADRFFNQSLTVAFSLEMRIKQRTPVFLVLNISGDNGELKNYSYDICSLGKCTGSAQNLSLTIPSLTPPYPAPPVLKSVDPCRFKARG